MTTPDVMLRQIVAVHNTKSEINRRLADCKGLYESLDYDNPKGDRLICKLVRNADRMQFLRWNGCALGPTADVGVIVNSLCKRDDITLEKCMAGPSSTFNDLCQLEMELEDLLEAVRTLYDYLCDQRENTEEEE